MTSKYVAKYAFNGNPAQNQLSFPVGATIVARDGQDGKPWFWGNYMGRDGWFPPTYVAKMAPAPAPVTAAPIVSRPVNNGRGGTVQNQMAGVTFTSSTVKQNQRRPQQQQQKQQVNPLLSISTGTSGGGVFTTGNMMNSTGMNSGATGFGIAAATGGFQSGKDDPFAGLENATQASNITPSLTPSKTTSQSSQTAPTTQTTTSPFPTIDINRGNSGVSTITTTTTASAAMGQQILNTNSTTPVIGTTKTVQRPTQMDPAKTPELATSNVSKSFSQGVNPFKSGGGMSLTMSTTPISTTLSTTPSVSLDKISSAFENVQIASPKRSVKEEGCEVAIPPSPTSPGDDSITTKALQPDTSQKALIEKELAERKAKEQERINREREQEWQRKVEAEREKRLQEAAKQTSEQSMQNTALPTPRADGIGLSGSSFSQLRQADLNSSSVPMLHPKLGKGFFDPYAFISDSKGEPNRKFNPIYRVQPFWALLNIESYVRRLPQAPENNTVAAKYDQLAKAISFMCHIVQENERTCGKRRGADAPLSFLKANQLGLEACIKMIASLPHSAGASGKQLDQLFLNFINAFVSLITHIQPHQQIYLPGGWQQPEGKSHLCLYILRNCGNDKFSFTVCNTGDGLEYHPSSFDPSSGLQLKQIAMTIWDIKSERILDSSFWVLLFRMQVYPNKNNNACLLYEKLLPALNSRPLWSNLDCGPAEYLEVPDLHSRNNFHFLAKLALTTIPAPGAYPSRYSALLVMNAAVDIAHQSIEDAEPGSMDPEDTRILKLSGRNLASYASTIDSDQVADNILGASLSSTWELLDRLLKKINYSASKPMDQYSHGMSTAALTDNFAKGKVNSFKVDPGAACFPFFGRFRRDNYEKVVKELMGEQRPDPILIPAVLTDEALPPVATDYQIASSSLQRACQACSLLLHQVELVKNAPAFVASAAQHALTVTLPMPHLDPKLCFWRKNPMRRETQINLLFLIRRMCRIYSAATTCVQQSRGLIAIRTTAFACAACIADAISRVAVVDDPSPFALHYNGQCEGPTEPFSIEAGSFETLAANMPIFDAHFTSLRCLCLDYLRGNSLMMDGSKRPTIFNFDKSLVPMKGDLILIDQLSIQLAMPRPYPRTVKSLTSNASSLISGKNGSLLEILPEMEYFRDIVFHFKHSVSGKAAAPTDIPENFTWLPHHATLKWTTRPLSSEDNTPIYNVSAFRSTLQEFVVVEEKSSSKTAFRSFLRFFGKGTEEQRKLSAADPTNIVNSCGEKFLKSK